MLCFVFHVARAETRHTAQLLLLFIIVFFPFSPPTVKTVAQPPTKQETCSVTPPVETLRRQGK